MIESIQLPIELSSMPIKTVEEKLPMYSGLLPSELERLVLLCEECSEIIHIASKIIRHGYDNWSPKDLNRTSNRNLLEIELGDMLGISKLMLNAGDISHGNINKHAANKLKNVQPYLHHQQ